MAGLTQQDRKDFRAIGIVAPVVALFAIGMFSLVGTVVHTDLGPGLIAGFPLTRCMIAVMQGQRYWRFLPRALPLSVLGLLVATPASISHRFVVQFPFLTLGLAIAAFGTLPLVRFEQSKPRPD